MSDALDRVRARRRLEESGASSAELEAFDAAAHGDATSSGPATSRERRELRHRARAADAPVRDAYRAGERDGRRTARPTPRRSTRRPTSPVELIQPGVANATGGLKVVGMALWIVALYLALEAAPQLSGFLGGATKALSWLASPTSTVPAKNTGATPTATTTAPPTTTTTTTTTPSSSTSTTTRPGAPVFTA